eukprot:COSAG02_NODE_281_length_25776_cov_37.797998_6_plen_111_part_00
MTLHPVSQLLSVQQIRQEAAGLVLYCGPSAITHANLSVCFDAMTAQTLFRVERASDGAPQHRSRTSLCWVMCGRQRTTRGYRCTVRLLTGRLLRAGWSSELEGSINHLRF